MPNNPKDNRPQSPLEQMSAQQGANQGQRADTESKNPNAQNPRTDSPVEEIESPTLWSRMGLKKVMDSYRTHASEEQEKRVDAPMGGETGYNMSFNRAAGVAKHTFADYIGHGIAIFITILILRPVSLLLRVMRGLFSCDHKNMGQGYLVFSLLALLLALWGGLSNGMEYHEVGIQHFMNDTGVVSAERWLAILGAGDIIMVYYGIIPFIMGGLAVYFVPLTIGSPEMLFSRLTSLSLWLLLVSFAVFVWAMGHDHHALIGWSLDVGWLVQDTTIVSDGIIMAMLVWGVAMFLLAVSLVITIIWGRAQNMAWLRLPIFDWGVMIGACMMIVVVPFLLAILTMTFIEKHTDVGFFVTEGYDVLLYYKFFHIFAVPMAYGVTLVGVGIVSRMLATFTRKDIFARYSLIISMVLLAILSLCTWALPLFAWDISENLETATLIFNGLKLIPIMLILLTWLGTMWGGTMYSIVSMYWAKLFIVAFAYSQLTYTLLAPLGLDVPLLHIYGVAGIAGIAGLYYWMAKMTGHQISEIGGRVHGWMTLVALLMTFTPYYALILLGLPVDTMDYVNDYGMLYQVMSLGYYGLFASGVYMIVLLIWTSVYGNLASASYWGREVPGLEWTVSSPPPDVTFERPVSL